MNMQYAKMFHKALELLTEASTEMSVVMENEINEVPDIGNICERLSAFDEALGIVINARNDFCQEDDIAIENGEIIWKISEAMKEAEEDGHLS